MQDTSGPLDKLLRTAIECQLISDFANDPSKRALFARLALNLHVVASAVQNAITAKEETRLGAARPHLWDKQENSDGCPRSGHGSGVVPLLPRPTRKHDAGSAGEKVLHRTEPNTTRNEPHPLLRAMSATNVVAPPTSTNPVSTAGRAFLAAIALSRPILALSYRLRNCFATTVRDG